MIERSKAEAALSKIADLATNTPENAPLNYEPWVDARLADALDTVSWDEVEECVLDCAQNAILGHGEAPDWPLRLKAVQTGIKHFQRHRKEFFEIIAECALHAAPRTQAEAHDFILFFTLNHILK